MAKKTEALPSWVEEMPLAFRLVAIDDSIHLAQIVEGLGDNLSDGDGWSLPGFAARFGSVRCLELFKARGLDLDDRYDDGRTLLMLSSRSDRLDAVRWLLRNGADPDAPGEGGMRPVHEFAVDGNAEGLEVLLAAGADSDPVEERDPWFTPLAYAAEAGESACCRLLLAYGADPQRRFGDRSVAQIAAEQSHAVLASELSDYDGTPDALWRASFQAPHRLPTVAEWLPIALHEVTTESGSLVDIDSLDVADLDIADLSSLEGAVRVWDAIASQLEASGSDLECELWLPAGRHQTRPVTSELAALVERSIQTADPGVPAVGIRRALGNRPVVADDPTVSLTGAEYIGELRSVGEPPGDLDWWLVLAATG